MDDQVLAVQAESEMRRNFRHLYADIAGYGVLMGSTLGFIAVYATRLGALSWQVSLLTAGPALVNLLLALPAGQWVARRRLASTVLWTAIAQRSMFPLLVPLVLLVPESLQTWLILAMVVLTAIPATPLTVAFNAMLAEAVPDHLRGEVVGRRNAAIALTMLVTYLLSGQILDRLPMQMGYTLVFAIGAVGAVFSTYHLMQIRLPESPTARSWEGRRLGDAARPGRSSMAPDMPLARTFGARMLARVRGSGMRAMLRPLRTSFGPFLFALFAFHLTQYIPIPLFPLYWVRAAQLDDAAIALLNAVFYTVMLAASLTLNPLSRRFGNRKLMGLGAVLLASYPLLTGLSTDLSVLLTAALLGGGVWAVLGGALYNRLLERVPDSERPSHLALYNMAMNAAMLLGSLVGGLLADTMGLQESILLTAALRVLSGLLLWRLG